MLAGFSSAWQATHGNCVLVCSPTTEPRDANDGRERLMTLEPPPHLPEALLPLTEELHHHGMPWTAAVGCFGQHGMLGHEQPRPSLDLHRSSLFDMASYINRRHLHDALFARHRLPFDAGFFSSRPVMQAPYMQPGRKDKRFCNANKNHRLFSCQSCVCACWCRWFSSALAWKWLWLFRPQCLLRWFGLVVERWGQDLVEKPTCQSHF